MAMDKSGDKAAGVTEPSAPASPPDKSPPPDKASRSEIRRYQLYVLAALSICAFQYNSRLHEPPYAVPALLKTEGAPAICVDGGAAAAMAHDRVNFTRVIVSPGGTFGVLSVAHEGKTADCVVNQDMVATWMKNYMNVQKTKNGAEPGKATDQSLGPSINQIAMAVRVLGSNQTLPRRPAPNQFDAPRLIVT